MKEKVLVVDDEKDIVDVLVYALNKEGYITERAYDGREALKKIEEFKPSVIILDVMMPEIDGYGVCKKICDNDMGIIMLTAKNDVVDKILGLEFGADDYLTKPFDIREVTARVRALVRRLNKSTTDEVKTDNIKIEGFYINKENRIAGIENEKEIEFTAMEFDLLYLLISNVNRAYSREQLLDIIWGMDYVGGTRTVDTHIQRIRKKLGSKYSCLIQTVHGVGYKGVNVFEGRN